MALDLKYTLKDEAFKLISGNKYAFSPEKFDFNVRDISVFCAKNDTAAFQLVLYADSDFVINTAGAPYFSQKGALPVIRIDSRGDFSVSSFIEDMHTDDDRLKKADALLSSPAFEVSSGEPRAVYFEADIPKDTKAGNYSLKIRLLESAMFESEREIAALSVNITVFDYTIPDVRDNKFHLDLWQHASNIARKAEVPLWSDDHFEVLERYAKSLGELGQKAVTLVVSEVPWAGQSCTYETNYRANLFEYSIVGVRKNADGRFSYDFGAMQRYIDICAKCGIDREISLYGLCGVWQTPDGNFAEIADGYPDKIKIRYYDETDGLYKYMTHGAEIDAYIAALEDYFIKTRQIDRVRIAADEPADTEAYRRSLFHLKQIAPRFKFKAAIDHPEFIAEFGEEISDFVPRIEFFCGEYQTLKKYMEQYPDKRFLYYVCCVPKIPNTFISSLLVESLYLGVFASYAGLDGFLRWNYTVWNDNPREDIRYGHYWRAGDTNFVYPQNNGAPLLSLRYKLLKRGIQLYELLEKLKETGDTDAASRAFDFVLRERDFAKFREHQTVDTLCSVDYADYADMKKFILERLSDR